VFVCDIGQFGGGGHGHRKSTQALTSHQFLFLGLGGEVVLPYIAPVALLQALFGGTY